MKMCAKRQKDEIEHKQKDQQANSMPQIADSSGKALLFAAYFSFLFLTYTPLHRKAKRLTQDYTIKTHSIMLCFAYHSPAVVKQQSGHSLSQRGKSGRIAVFPFFSLSLNCLLCFILLTACNHCLTRKGLELRRNRL